MSSLTSRVPSVTAESLNGVDRHCQSPDSWSLPVTRQKSGPFPPPALPGINSTTGLSATPYGPACSSRSSGCETRPLTAGASRVPVDSHLQTCRRHYPGGTGQVLVSLLTRPTAAFPEKLTGRLPQLGLSRPAQRSLAFRPACSLNRPRRPVTLKASTDSLPPPPLQLLPAGATRRRVGIAPTGDRRLSRRTVF